MNSVPLWQKPLFGLVAGYAIISTLYIVLSDQIVYALVNGGNPERLTRIQTFKGALFILLTTALLYFLIRWFLKVNVRRETAFQQMFWKNPNPMFIYDIQTMRFVDVNDAAISQYGYSMSEFLGMTIKDIRPREDVPRLVENVEQLEDGFSYGGTWRHIRKDGSMIYVDIYGYVCDYKGRECETILALNVTERVLFQRERNHLTSLLLERNQQVQGLAYSLAHNFRAPVANLMGLTELIRIHAGSCGDVSDQLDMQEKALNTLDQTIRDLTQVLESTGTLSGSREYLELNVQFDVIRHLFREQLGQVQATVHADFSRAEVVYFNRQVLASLFFNLLSNAIKFYSPDRHLEISVTASRQEGDIVVRFTDNGVGMDPDLIGGKIFNMYQRFNTDKPGRGLGLYLVKYQLQELNSSITVDTIKGEGTTFEVRIPSSVTESE